MIKQPAQARRIVYGTVRASGTLVFAETTDDDKFLHMVIALAGHEINQFSSFRIDESDLTIANNEVDSPSRFVVDGTRLVQIYSHLGTDDQTADANLVSRVSKWTNQHRLRGIAYVYARLEFSADAFPQGLPNLSATMQGKKVFDPRDSTTAFSNNPALCIRDYLTDSRYGLGAPSSEIDDTAFQAAANACDETVALSGGGTQKRYTLDGTFETSQTPKEILEQMLTSCGGILTYTNGKFSLKVAEYTAPSITLTEDDMIGPVSIQATRSQQDNYNAVKGVFSPSSSGYIPTDYPPVTSATFEAEDNNERRFLDYDLPFTTHPARAQRLAKIALFRNRQQVSLQLQASLKAFDLKVGDTVSVTLPRFGFSAKVFEVAEWNITLVAGDQLGIDLVLRETASTVYDWNAEESAFAEDNSTLPDPFTIPAVGLVVTDELQLFNEKATSVLIADVSSGSVYGYQFEVQAKKSTDTEFISLGVASSTRFELPDVEDNAIYDVRARAISSFGIRSEFTTAQHQVVGKTDPPANVTDFSVNIIGTEAHLSWTPVDDLDLSHYVVRHARETSNADAWIINDTKRNPINNGSIVPLYPNAANAEPSGINFDFLSNGFKIRNTDGDTNTSGATYTYMAFGQTIVGSNNVPCTAR